MKNLKITTDPKIKLVFDKYPSRVRRKLLYLRNLILETAQTMYEINDLEETLKWGEPKLFG